MTFIQNGKIFFKIVNQNTAISPPTFSRKQGNNITDVSLYLPLECSTDNLKINLSRRYNKDMQCLTQQNVRLLNHVILIPLPLVALFHFFVLVKDRQFRENQKKYRKNQFAVQFESEDSVNSPYFVGLKNSDEFIHHFVQIFCFHFGYSQCHQVHFLFRVNTNHFIHQHTKGFPK